MGEIIKKVIIQVIIFISDETDKSCSKTQRPCYRKGLLFGMWYPLHTVIDTPGLTDDFVKCNDLECLSPDLNNYLKLTLLWSNVIVITVKATDVTNTMKPITLLDSNQWLNVVIAVNFMDIYIKTKGTNLTQLEAEISQTLVQLKIYQEIPVFFFNYNCLKDDFDCNFKFGTAKHLFHDHLATIPAKPYLFTNVTHYQNLNYDNANLLTTVLKEMIAFQKMEKKYGDKFYVKEKAMENVLKIYDSINFSSNEFNYELYIVGGVLILVLTMLILALIVRVFWLKKKLNIKANRDLQKDETEMQTMMVVEKETASMIFKTQMERVTQTDSFSNTSKDTSRSLKSSSPSAESSGNWSGITDNTDTILNFINYFDIDSTNLSLEESSDDESLRYSTAAESDKDEDTASYRTARSAAKNN